MLKRFLTNYRVFFNSLYYYRLAGTTTSHNICWKCAQNLTSNLTFCAKCQAIQPVYHENFFSYFGINKSFSLAEEDLKKRFRQLQSMVHPDKFGKSSPKEKELSESHSSFLNQAYKTLIDPRARGHYILKLENKEKPIQDNEFAVEIMELNERIEELEDVNEIKSSLSEVQNQIKSLTDALEISFQKNNYDEANKCLHRLNFYERTRKLLLKKLK